jgi:hypothetical protein
MDDWMKCSDPPEESCADAGCPIHGDDEFSEPEWDSEDSNAYVAAQEALAGTPPAGEQETTP